jgi:hypothetical protein
MCRAPDRQSPTGWHNLRFPWLKRFFHGSREQGSAAQTRFGNRSGGGAGTGADSAAWSRANRSHEESRHSSQRSRLAGRILCQARKTDERLTVRCSGRLRRTRPHNGTASSQRASISGRWPTWKSRSTSAHKSFRHMTNATEFAARIDQQILQSPITAVGNLFIASQLMTNRTQQRHFAIEHAQVEHVESATR